MTNKCPICEREGIAMTGNPVSTLGKLKGGWVANYCANPNCFSIDIINNRVTCYTWFTLEKEKE